MSGDFDVQTTVNGTKGKVVVEAINKDDNFLSFLNMAGDVLDPNGKPIPLRLVQTGPGTYEAEFNATEAGSYVVGLSYRGQKTSGILRGGVAVNSQPEFRDLQSNDQKLHEVVDKTGGNLIAPWDAEGADLFSRSNVMVTASPLPVWDILLPILLGLILLDVATRRIAWDLASTRRLMRTVTERVRSFTTVSRVETRTTLDAFKRVKEEVAETKFKTPEGGTPAPPRPPPIPGTQPDPKAKFEARAGVEGDITQVVGGASDKPIPSAPKKIEPKGGTGKDPGGHTSSLLEAKRRAQQQIKKKEEGQ
jgi:hypothetical protein